MIVINILIATAVLVNFIQSQETKSNDTNFVASNQWQEIKHGKCFLFQIVLLNALDCEYFRTKGPIRPSLQDKS